MGFWRDLFGRPDQAPAETRSVDTFPVPFDVGGLPYATVTQDRALSLAPVFAACRLLAGTVSTLPLKAYRRVGDERVPMPGLPQLFYQLITDGELVPWLHRCMVSLVLRGNAYGWITARDGFGFPTRIEWLNPADVAVDDSASTARPVWLWRGREIPREDVVHIPWFPVPGRVVGLSPIAQFAEVIGVGLNAQDYGSTWFANGGFPPGTFKNTEKTVTQDQADGMRSLLGRAMRSGQPLVYGADWDYKAISVPPNEAQFIESSRMNATQVAAIYGLPPEDVGGTRGSSLTYATVELNQLDRTLALRPWLVLLESKFASLLPERQYVRFTADAIVRTDLRTRWDVHQVAVGMGARSIDEVRNLEDLPPLPDGQGAKYVTAAVKAAQTPPQPPAQRAPERMWVIPA